MAFFDKEALLEDAKNHKSLSIIMIGGSNVSFSSNSKILKDSLNRPIINTGLIAGLGLKFMLDHTSKYLLPGDIVVISPEYEHFFNTKAYGECTLGTLFYMYPSIGKEFNLAQINTVVCGISGSIQQIISANLARSNYKRLGFNEFGDYVAHWQLPSKPHGLPLLDTFKDINTDFLDYYSQKVSLWRSQGIKVIIIPPPHPEKSHKIIKERIDALIPELESRGINFAIPPEEFVYDESLFFDSRYHLNYTGLTIRTARVLEIIRSYN
jgi:hypothetical protein